MTLPRIVAGIVLVALNAYVLTGGADFGGGVWDLLASGPRKDEQRRLISSSIGPIWEANHVWLILVVVMLFTAFPPVFATVSTVLHIPLTLMLAGIVLRGTSFMFRSYGATSDIAQRRWGRVFASASIVTPLVLGTIVGAIASGRVGSASGSFTGVFVRPWFAPFPLLIGAMALALFAFLAAVYLAVAAPDDALREDFRRRALGSAAAVFVTAFAGLALGFVHAPDMSQNLVASSWALVLQSATAFAALLAIGAVWRRRYQLARFAAAMQVSLILWGWGASQYPFILPPHVTVDDAAAPRITLVLLLWALLAGSVILIPSLVFLFRNFGRPTSSGH